jgi:hypothetical protein
MWQRRLTTLAAGWLLLGFVAPVCWAQSVLQRKRLGNNTEGITAIRSGPLEGNVALMDGLDVLALPEENEDEGARKLFNVLPLGVTAGPRGIAYIDSQRQFVFDDPTQIPTLYLSDIHGNAQGTITVTYPAGFTPDHVEGLAWLPAEATYFPNTLVQVAISFGATSNTTRLEVIDPSGVVIAEIFPKIFASDPDPFDFVTGLGFQSPDHLLVGTADGSLWQIDFSGNALLGPVTFPGVTDLEGIAQTRKNRIAVEGYSAGKLMFVDGNLNRVAGEDQNYRIGFGLSLSQGVAWDSDTERHLVSFPGTFAPSIASEVISLTRSLHRENEVVNLAGASTPRALSYLPDDHRIAVAQTGCAPNCSILLYDNGGTLKEQVQEAPNLPVMEYVPTLREFVARRGADPTTAVFFSRTGPLVNSLDLSGIIGGIAAIAFFNPGDPSGGHLLIASGSFGHRLLVVDLNGNLLQQFDYRASLGVVSIQDLAAITTGPQAGAFSLVTSDTSEIVVFRLN